MIKQMLIEIRQTTLAQAVRMLSACGAALMLVWTFGGPFVKPFVDSAIAQVLVDQGVSPDDFKDAIDHIEKNTKKLDDLVAVSIKRDAEVAQILHNQTLEISQNADMKRTLDEMINTMIRKQFGQVTP